MRALDNLLGQTPSGRLYHYTNYPALMGIVERGEMWATNVAYLNDSTELTFAQDPLHAAVERAYKTAKYPVTLIEDCDDLVNKIGKQDAGLYVACFSEDGDLLSQWQGYTSVGTGLSIGFETHNLAVAAMEAGFVLSKCLYDKDEIAATCSAAIEELLDLAMELGPVIDEKLYPPDSYETALAGYKHEIALLAASIKNPAFRAEREWRLFGPVRSGSTSDVRFRSGKFSLIPYVAIPLRAKDSARVDLASVRLGPTVHGGLATKALAAFLARGLSNEPELQRSAVPFRET